MAIRGFGRLVWFASVIGCGAGPEGSAIVGRIEGSGLSWATSVRSVSAEGETNSPLSAAREFRLEARSLGDHQLSLADDSGRVLPVRFKDGRDRLTINDAGLTMVFTSERHFRH